MTVLVGVGRLRHSRKPPNGRHFPQHQPPWHAPAHSATAGAITPREGSPHQHSSAHPIERAATALQQPIALLVRPLAISAQDGQAPELVAL